MGVQVQKEVCTSCSSLRNDKTTLSQLTRCYGWHVPLPAFSWTTKCGYVWDEGGRGWGGVNLGCRRKNAFLKPETHAQLHWLPPKWAVSHIRAERGGCLHIQPHWGSGRAAKGKQHFSFLNWGCQCVRPRRGKTMKLTGQVKRWRIWGRKNLRHTSEQASCRLPKTNLTDEDGTLNPLPQVRQKYFNAN